MTKQFTHELHITVHLFGKGDTENSHDQIVVHRLISASSEQGLARALKAAQQEFYEERKNITSQSGGGWKDPQARFRLELSAQECPAVTIVDSRGMSLPKEREPANP